MKSRPLSSRTVNTKARKLRDKFKPVQRPCDGPPVDALHTTLYPGSQLIITLGLAYGRVVVTYPVGKNPTAIIEPGQEKEAIRVEFERVDIAEVLDKSDEK